MNFKIILSTTLCLVMILAFFASCSDNETDDSGVSVVATLFPQYDFAKAILGDKGEVTLLLTPGANSHSFELTASDISKINNCDIFVYIGPQMEVWVDSIISSIGEDVAVLNLSESVNLVCSVDDTHVSNGEVHTHTADPHIWTNPVIAMKMLTKVYEAICKADPGNKGYYEDNYNSYMSKLVALDEEFRRISENAKDKTLYFSGKFAFMYFVNEYGFDYVAPFNSCSDLQVEDLATVASLIQEMNSKNIEYIFYEEFAGGSLHTTIAEQTNAIPLLLHSAHNLSKADFDKGVTYVDIMHNNAVNLKRALLDG